MKKFGDLVKMDEFHKEIEEVKYRNDIIDKDIIIYDSIKKSFINKKSKYGKETLILLVSFLETPDSKFKLFISGDVLIDQIGQLIALNELPAKEGIQTRIKKDKYYKFV